MKEWIVREDEYPLATGQTVVGEIVRCKDCKWHNTTEYEKCVAYDAFWVTDPDDYCAWGERREDE